MSETNFERLTQMDNSFLIFESERSAMHVASTQIHEAAPLRNPDGSLQIERIQEYVLSRLHRIPRYRQKLARTPLEGRPVWVDDPNFNIVYHVRHSRLPRPGCERQLKRMVGRIFSQLLDREKPLWELWVIEGLEGDRVAVCSKVHHCMVDGVSGSELIATLLTSTPTEKVEPPGVWRPRSAPSPVRLGVDEIVRAARLPFSAVSALARVAFDRDGARHDFAERARAARRMMTDASGMTPVPFNQPVGPYRRIDWLPIAMERIKAVRRAAGGTVNDVVLATAAGGIGRYLRTSRGVDLEPIRFKTLAPVSTRSKQEQASPGNRVSAWVVELPVAEPDPLARLRMISAQTEELKASKRALGAEALSGMSEWTGSGLLSLSSRVMSYGTPFNTVITNVPGPQTPLYMLESRLLEIHPHVPILGQLGVGIALFSYDGTLSWGFTADWDLVPDLHDLAEAVAESFSALEQAAGVYAASAPPGSPRSARAAST
jgi:diacylglycerol O-acyltransferase